MVLMVLVMVDRHDHLLLDFHVFHNGERHVLNDGHRHVFDDGHLLDDLDFLDYRHVHWNVHLGHVVVVDRVDLVGNVDGHVFVSAAASGCRGCDHYGNHE